MYSISLMLTLIHIKRFLDVMLANPLTQDLLTLCKPEKAAHLLKWSARFPWFRLCHECVSKKICVEQTIQMEDKKEENEQDVKVIELFPNIHGYEFNPIQQTHICTIKEEER